MSFSPLDIISWILIAVLCAVWIRLLYGYHRKGGTLDRWSGYSGGNTAHRDDWLYGSRGGPTW